MFAYKKELKRFHADTAGLRISSLILGKTIVTGTFEAYGEICKPDEFPLFDPVRTMLCQPVVSKFLGYFFYTRFGMRLPSSIMQPIRAKMSVKGNVPGLAQGDYSWEGFDVQAEGACRLRSPWHLQEPFSRTSITETVPARGATG